MWLGLRGYIYGDVWFRRSGSSATSLTPTECLKPRVPLFLHILLRHLEQQDTSRTSAVNVTHTPYHISLPLLSNTPSDAKIHDMAFAVMIGLDVVVSVPTVDEGEGAQTGSTKP